MSKPLSQQIEIPRKTTREINIDARGFSPRSGDILRFQADRSEDNLNSNEEPEINARLDYDSTTQSERNAEEFQLTLSSDDTDVPHGKYFYNIRLERSNEIFGNFQGTLLICPQQTT